MSTKEQEETLIRFLKKEQYVLFRQLPIKLVDLHYMISNDPDGLQIDLIQFEELCEDLHTCLPMLFVLHPLSKECMILSGCQYELIFFDIEYLESWLISWSLTDDTDSSVSSSLPSSPSESSSFSNPVLGSEPSPDHLLRILEEESSFVTDQRTLLESLLTFETSKFKLRKEQILSECEKPFLDFCNKGSRTECLAQGRLRCLEKIHFEPVITANTDVSIGDCSYLDTCYKGKSCKFVHYKIVYPDNAKRNDRSKKEKEDEIPGYFETKAYPSGLVPPRPAQWIDGDIRRLKLEKLGKFEAIIADPPWDIHMNSYQQSSTGFMTDQEIIDLPIEKIQSSGVFCLWVTGRALDVGRQCLAKWGYTKVEEIIWCKTNQLARIICTGRTGHWLNHSKEHCLIGTKGNVDWMIGGIDIDVITSATRDKSHKPDELYDIVERLVGPCARKLELFGRKHNIRPGWLTIGNQLSNTRVLEENLLQAL